MATRSQTIQYKVQSTRDGKFVFRKLEGEKRWSRKYLVPRGYTRLAAILVVVRRDEDAAKQLGFKPRRIVRKAPDGVFELAIYDSGDFV